MNAGNFMPPMPQMPQMPAGGGNFNGTNMPGGVGQMPRNAPSYEQQSQIARSVYRSGQIKQATKTVIKTRSQFKEYLAQNGLDLYTSAIEFQQTGDFIVSSYVVYRNHNDFMEPLSDFLERYPNLKQPVAEIRDRLKPVQGSMQVSTPRLSQMGADSVSF